MHTPRRKGRGQPRILYWFRTPPGVRVGRAAIDEDAIRLIEQHNPDVQFDWTRILKQPSSYEPPPRQAKPLPRGRRDERSASPRRELEPESQSSDLEPRSSDLEPQSPDLEPRSPDLEPRFSDLESAPSDLEPPVSELDARTAEEDSQPPLGDEPPASPVELRPAAVSARIGPEGLARLRARYAEVMARITERQLDEAAREELTGRAERLNPDAWVTDDEVREGLEQYETVFESLRPMVGHPRRRRRRRG